MHEAFIRREDIMYRKIKAFFALSLAVLMCCTGCGGESSPQTSGVVESQTTAEDERTAIIKNGNAEYKVVYPEGAGKNLVRNVESLVAQIKNSTGVELEIITDQNPYDESTKQILVGRTAYNISREITDSLGKEDFVIIEKETKILITGKSEDLVIKAISYYIKNLIEENVEQTSSGRSLYFEEYEYRSEANSLTIGGVDISKFSIVFASKPDGMSTVAYSFRDNIQKIYGCSLTVSSDSSANEKANEILIGNTNRSESTTFYAENNVKLMSYKMFVSGTKLGIACGGPYSANEFITDFYFNYSLNRAKSLTNGVHMEKNLLNLDSQPITATSDIRVMSANILADRWATASGKTTPVPQRAEIFAAVLATYKPDMVGLQESDEVWSKCFPYYLELLEEQYGVKYVWEYSTYDNVPCFTSILYRADKYTVLDRGIKCYSYNISNEKSYKLRVITWIVVKDFATNETYALMNTHWSGTSTENQIQVNESNEVLNSIKSKYSGAHVFYTGDFNFHVNSGFDTFKLGVDMTDGREGARSAGTLVNDVLGITTTSKIPADHVFYDNSVTVERYEIVDKNNTFIVSDHLPQYADFKIKK